MRDAGGGRQTCEGEGVDPGLPPGLGRRAGEWATMGPGLFIGERWGDIIGE